MTAHDDVIEQAARILDEHMGGYHATKWRQRTALRALHAAGLLADPQQTTELRAEVEQLKAALHSETRWREDMLDDLSKLNDRPFAKAARRLRDERDEAREWADCESGNVRELTAERDRLQARIDAALALLDDLGADNRPQIRAALQASQPTEETDHG